MEVETMLGAVLAIHHPYAAPAPRTLLFDCCDSGGSQTCQEFQPCWSLVADCCGIPSLMSVV